MLLYALSLSFLINLQNLMFFFFNSRRLLLLTFFHCRTRLKERGLYEIVKNPISVSLYCQSISSMVKRLSIIVDFIIQYIIEII